jgi:hypothetical protein
MTRKPARSLLCPLLNQCFGKGANIVVRLNFDENAVPALQDYVDKLPPGTYKLSDILGADWDRVLSKTDAGLQFRRYVSEGQLERIESAGKTSSNHQLYRVGQ